MRITYIVLLTNTCFAMADFKLFPEVLEFLFTDRYYSNPCTYRYTYSSVPNYRYSELYKAAAEGNELLVALFLKQDATKGPGALREAMYRKDLSAVKLLLYYGVEIQDMSINKNNDTYISSQITNLLKQYKQLGVIMALRPLEVLNEAIEQGYLGLVKFLLIQGVPVTLAHVYLAKKACEKAEFKSVYRAIGRLLLAYLRLTGDMQTAEKTVKQRSCFSSSFLSFLLLKRTTHSIQEPIAHNGLQATGLPKNTVENIARMVVSSD